MKIFFLAKKKSLLFCLAALCLLAQGSQLFGVIYGKDDRYELNSPVINPLMRSVAKSTALLVLKSRVKFNNWEERVAQYVLSGQTLSQKFNLCTEDRFGDQPVPGFCTAFLQYNCVNNLIELR